LVSKKLTSLDLQIAFYYKYIKALEFMVPNVYLKDYELDIFCLRPSGYVEEIEIKLTASDFKADFNKTVRLKSGDITPSGWNRIKPANKHEALQEGLLPTNRFSFLVPEELVDKCSIPDYAGLYTYKNGVIKKVKAGKLLHKNKISDKLKYKTAKKMVYRYWGELTK
jgi:hypothetical protein